MQVITQRANKTWQVQNSPKKQLSNEIQIKIKNRNIMRHYKVNFLRNISKVPNSISHKDQIKFLYLKLLIQSATDQIKFLIQTSNKDQIFVYDPSKFRRKFRKKKTQKRRKDRITVQWDHRLNMVKHTIYIKTKVEKKQGKSTGRESSQMKEMTRHLAASRLEASSRWPILRKERESEMKVVGDLGFLF